MPRSVSQRAQGSVVGASLHPVALVNVEVLGTNGCLVATDHRGPRPIPALSYRRESRSPPEVRRATLPPDELEERVREYLTLDVGSIAGDRQRDGMVDLRPPAPGPRPNSR